MSFIVPALAGFLAFCIVLPLLTFLTAWAADVTGLFGLLFIRKPTRLAFRVLRWAIAILAGVAVAVSLH